MPVGNPSFPSSATLAALTPKASESAKPMPLSGVIEVSDRSLGGLWAAAGRDDA